MLAEQPYAPWDEATGDDGDGHGQGAGTHASEREALRSLPADLQVACLHEGLASLEAAALRSANLAVHGGPPSSAQAAKRPAEYGEARALLTASRAALQHAEDAAGHHHASQASAPPTAPPTAPGPASAHEQLVEQAVDAFFAARRAVTALVAEAPPQHGSSSAADGSSKHPDAMEPGMHAARETKFWMETMLQPVLQPVLQRVAQSARSTWRALTGHRQQQAHAAPAGSQDASSSSHAPSSSHGQAAASSGHHAGGGGVQAAALPPHLLLHSMPRQANASGKDHDGREGFHGGVATVAASTHPTPHVGGIFGSRASSKPPQRRKRHPWAGHVASDGDASSGSGVSPVKRPHHSGFWSAIIHHAESSGQPGVTHGSLHGAVAPSRPPVWNGSHLAPMVDAEIILSFAVRSARSAASVPQPVPPSLPPTTGHKDCPPVPPLRAEPPPLDALRKDQITGWGDLKPVGTPAAGGADGGRWRRGGAAEKPPRPPGPPPPQTKAAGSR